MAEFEGFISSIVPGYAGFVSDLVNSLGEYLVGGVLIAFIVWVIGYAVNAVYGWLDEWSR